MAKRLYVGNLSFKMTNSDLETLFAPFGSVRNAQVVMEPGSDRSRGFGFVEMERDNEASAAITALNDQEHDGRRLVVNEARPREERRGGGGGGGGGGGRSGGGRSGGGGRRW
jgi:RNA recognition motif-containing protein